MIRLKAKTEVAVRLVPEGSATITGVVEYGGELPAEIAVNLNPFGERPREQLPPGRVVMAKEGRFELRGVEPGTYWLRVFRRVPGQRRFLQARQKIELAEGEAKIVTLRLR